MPLTETVKFVDALPKGPEERPGKWMRTVTALGAKPGVWALVAHSKSSTGGSTFRDGAMKAAAKLGKTVEVQSFASGKGRDIYARVVA